ncbi:hypothetical protein [Thermococcus stetteri]|uniref:hypothetical protein n=1 Tax=Thermococcus stetteri TaxID=49900 RepID=UPI001FD79E53|nr:hypothetical protein [Thermococcus stetteri]MBP1911098.1 hypothetical protein [Thermococcus stetteri]
MRSAIFGLFLLLLVTPLAVADEWARTYNIQDSDFVYLGHPLITDGGIYLPGVYDVGFSSKFFYVMSFDPSTGDLVWVKKLTFKVNGTELKPQSLLKNSGLILRKCLDGNIIGFFRVSRLDATAFSGTVVFKITPGGEVLWARYYRAWQYKKTYDKYLTRELIPVDAAVTEDGIYVLAETIGWFSSSGDASVLMKLSPDGKLECARVYGAYTPPMRPVGIEPLGNGQVLLLVAWKKLTLY